MKLQSNHTLSFGYSYTQYCNWLKTKAWFTLAMEAEAEMEAETEES